MRWALLLFHLLVVWTHSKETVRHATFLEIGAKARADAQHQEEVKLAQLQSIKDLNAILDEGRQKLAESRFVLEQTPAAPAAAPAAPAPAPGSAGATSGMAGLAAADLVAPPQLQPLALPSYGPASQIDELADIQREQLALRQKKVMVAQQKRIIQDSEDSAAKLQQLIGVNKQIEQKNEQALGQAGQHLLDRIKSYSDRLAQEQISTTGGGTALSATAVPPAALLEQDGSQVIQVPSSQQAQVSQMQQLLNQQAHTIQRLQSFMQRRRHRRRRRRSQQEEQDENVNDSGDSAL